MSIVECDFLVVGAGIAGASVAAELALEGRVVLLEAEEHAGMHSTGRSAALFSEGHGPRVSRALTAASRAFLERPPEGFCEVPLLAPRGVVHIGRADQEPTIEAFLADARGTGSPVREIEPAEALRLVPALRPGYVARAILEPDGMDLDVDALLQGYLRALRSRGGRIVTRAPVEALERAAEKWHARTPAGTFAAPVLVDAAGAWADEVARMAGVRAVGLQPKRRTAFLFRPPPSVQVASWPMVIDIDEELYFKPDAGRLLVSPADETPLPPHDVRPDELDVAVAVERLERATALEVRSIERKWAGLRSFVPDGRQVVGFAPDARGFFWLAGQGGSGIETSPAMAAAAASLILGRPWPEEIASRGVTAADLAPGRGTV